MDNTLAMSCHNQIILDEFCDDFKSSPFLKYLVREGSNWSTPGVSVLHGKVHKRREKQADLIHALGSYGPILDIIIRSTVPEMVILQFAKSPVKITAPCGPLKQSLIGKLKSQQFKAQDTSRETELFTDLINDWFSFKTNVKDYNTAYREKRVELLNSQVSHLLYCPYFIVS